MMDTQRIQDICKDVETTIGVKSGAFKTHPWALSSEGQPLARYFDHTLLKPDAPAEAFDKLFREALEVKPFSVCVPPNRVARAVEALKGSDVAVCTVVGFPLGYDTPDTKAAQVDGLKDRGCGEFDMVIPIGLAKDKNWKALYEDVRAVVVASDSALVKVILETALLTDEEIVAAGYASCLAGADMLKTSTGFAPAGASIEAIQLMRAVAPERVGIKASGGIKTLEFTQALIAAGADRIGASSTVAILEEAARS